MTEKVRTKKSAKRGPGFAGMTPEKRREHAREGGLTKRVKKRAKPKQPRKPDTHVRMQINAVLVLKTPREGLPPVFEIDINEVVSGGLLAHYRTALWTKAARAAGAKTLGEVPEPTEDEITAACPFGAVEGGATINWTVTKSKWPDGGDSDV